MIRLTTELAPVDISAKIFSELSSKCGCWIQGNIQAAIQEIALAPVTCTRRYGWFRDQDLRNEAQGRRK
jgi:hypothetical protein